MLAWLRRGDRWIPFTLVLGFMVMLSVNGVMVWLALATHPGLVTDAPGAARGAAAIALAPDAEAIRLEPVSVRFDAAGRRDIRSATLFAERPGRYAQAVSVPLAAAGEGLWRGALRLPIGGTWVLTARAETPDGPVLVQRTVEVLPGRRS